MNIKNNKVHLCDSCKYNYPECPSQTEGVIFGDAVGGDNICACSCYEADTIKTANVLYGKTYYSEDGKKVVDTRILCGNCEKPLYPKGIYIEGDYCQYCGARLVGNR